MRRMPPGWWVGIGAIIGLFAWMAAIIALWNWTMG